MTLHYLTASELEMSREEVNLQIVLGLQSCKTKADVCQLLDDVRAHERWVIAHEVIIELKSKRYQEHPFYLRYLIWLRWMPYAWLRGFYWWLFQRGQRFNYEKKYFKEPLHDCIDISIGDIQATKMYWIYSGAECMAMSKRNVK